MQDEQDVETIRRPTCNRWRWVQRILGPDEQDYGGCVAMRNQHGSHLLGDDAVVIIRVSAAKRELY